MIVLDTLLKPDWPAVKWLERIWSILDEEEQLTVKQRLDELFFSDVPFQLEHDKILYLHLFALLTQLEIFGLQGLMKSLEKLKGNPLYPRMRQQIIDEIFHAIIFARLTYQFSAPYALPPIHNKGIENFMSLLVNEPDLTTSFALINLVAEGWIEEIFLAMQAHNLAPHIFKVVLEDESRHIEEADLYLQIGLPAKPYLSRKIAAVEEELIKMIFSQKEYVVAIANLIGPNGLNKLAQNIDKKHKHMLKKIDCEPTQTWQFFMQTIPAMIEDHFHNHKIDLLLEKSNTRKAFSSLWSNPSQPTESAVFNINVSAVHFFEKKYPPETITCLFLQAISQALEKYPQFKNYLSHQKIYQAKESDVGLAVHLPECGDNLGLIVFENCHRMSLFELSYYIQDNINIMTYAYKKVEQLKKEHPYLMDIANELFSPCEHNIHQNPWVASSTISLSNIGHWGYESVISPLFPNETVKFTLCKIDKKQLWNNKNQQFEVQDLIPVCISIDHRVFDANLPVPAILQTQFDAMFSSMQNFLKTQIQTSIFVKPAPYLDDFIKHSEQLLENDLEVGFRYLFLKSHIYKRIDSKETFREQLEETL